MLVGKEGGGAKEPLRGCPSEERECVGGQDAVSEQELSGEGGSVGR